MPDSTYLPALYEAIELAYLDQPDEWLVPDRRSLAAYLRKNATKD